MADDDRLSQEAAAVLERLGDSAEEHPGMAWMRGSFAAQRIAEGMSSEDAIVATRRRFSTPEEPEARRRMLAAKDRLVTAGIVAFGVENTWTVDKPDIALVTDLGIEDARRLVEDALDGFVQTAIYRRPADHVDWWWRPAP